MNGEAITIGIPTAAECAWILGPVLALLAARWVWSHLDGVVERLFPHWEFEKRMGWLNLRAQRRAESVFRVLTYLLQALLALALYGILWAAEGFGAMTPADPLTVADAFTRLPVLLASLGLWLVYLGWELIPKLRRAYEEEELERFRAENPDLEEETRSAKSRVPTLEQNHTRLERRRR